MTDMAREIWRCADQRQARFGERCCADCLLALIARIEGDKKGGAACAQQIDARIVASLADREARIAQKIDKIRLVRLAYHMRIGAAFAGGTVADANAPFLAGMRTRIG